MSNAPDSANGESFQRLVAQQFGPQAKAYVVSAVHAQGDDLKDLTALAANARPARVLDLGCGGGHVSFTVAPFSGAVVAYDLSQEMLAAVADESTRRELTNISTRQGKAEALPFEDETFDWVVSRYSAHHWQDLAAGLREARRVLKPGGTAVFMDVVAPGWAAADTFLQAVELLRDPSHGRDYSHSEWLAHAHAAGLVVEQETPRRLRLEFASWVARIRTPELHISAIRALEQAASMEVARHFEIEPDGTFTLDTLTLLLRAG